MLLLPRILAILTIYGVSFGVARSLTNWNFRLDQQRTQIYQLVERLSCGRFHVGIANIKQAAQFLESLDLNPLAVELAISRSIEHWQHDIYEALLVRCGISPPGYLEFYQEDYHNLPNLRFRLLTTDLGN